MVKIKEFQIFVFYKHNRTNRKQNHLFYLCAYNHYYYVRTLRVRDIFNMATNVCNIRLILKQLYR